MTIQAHKSENLLILDDSDYPARFYILKSGVENCYLVVDEDPFECNIKLRNTNEVLSLCSKFDTSITEDDLPKYARLS